MQNAFQLPVLTINAVTPLLCKDGKVLSYKITGLTEDNTILLVYENKGLDLSNFIGDKMQCLLEITRGRLNYGTHQDKTNRHDFFTYEWIRRPFEFFPQLAEQHQVLQNLNAVEENLKRKIFENYVTEFYKDWGLNGIELGVYQSKPLLNSINGFFLLNEYEFEESIEYLKFNEEVNIRIDELFLRGIRPIPDNSKQKEYLATKKVIVPPAPKPPEEPKQNKGRFNLFPDKNS